MSLLIFKIKECIKSFPYRFKKAKIKAVYESDLVGVLQSLGVFGQISNGTEKCASCGDTIDLENIEALFLNKGKIKFICSKNDCVSKI